jgi:uncharacterized DUF497 family protein
VKIFTWNPEKNALLLQTRGITFDEIVQEIEAGAVCIETDHPNKNKYPDQKVLIVKIDNYAYLVPCVVNGDEDFLKTIIPSRKATKKHFGGKNE